MFLVILSLFFFVVTEFVVNYKKHLTYVFMLYFFGICALLCASMFYMIKFTTYRSSIALDYNIYNIVKNMNISVSDVSRVMNIGIIMLMFGSVCIFNITTDRRRLKTNILLAIPIVLFTLLFDPYVSYRLWILQYIENADLAHIVSVAIPQINLCARGFFILYMLLPLACLYKRYGKSKIHALYLNALLLCICIILIDVYVYFCFINGFLAMFMPWNVDLNKIPTEYFNGNFKVILLLMTVLFAMIIAYITIWYKPLGTIKFFNNIAYKRSFREINRNIRMIFHANKNAFLAIERLSNQFIEYINTEPNVAVTIAQDICKMSNEGLNTLTHTLNMMGDISRKNMTTDLCSCIRSSMKRIILPENISIYKIFKSDPVYINASPIHISECLVNIINNAVDAIDDAGREHGKIRISLECENNYACLEITDNGCGISKKDKKNIFSMLYSTKNTSIKWGIGLSYVKKVIEAYDGFIYVKSKKGEYTVFQIALPLINYNNI